MVKALVIGRDGKIGSALMNALVENHVEAAGTSRRGNGIAFDLTESTASLPDTDVVFICAAATRFIDCESDSQAYRVNVDAPVNIARRYRGTHTKIIFLSSEAVERALHTNYGMHKALAETALAGQPNVIIVRLSKVDDVKALSEFLARMVHAEPGLYRWPGEGSPFARHRDCAGGKCCFEWAAGECKKRCEVLARFPDMNGAQARALAARMPAFGRMDA